MKDWVNKNIKKIEIVLLIAVILLQVFLRIYIGNEKTYLHIDEGYSYGLMNYKQVDIIANEDFYDTWHSKEYYNDYLTISEEEKWDFSPVYENQKNDVHPPMYYLLLRIANMFSINSFTKWTGITLNILLFIATSVMIYMISNIIFKNKLYSILVVLINGFTIASIETTIFIRMYALNALNLLIITYLHMKNYNKAKLEIKDLALMSIAILIGALTHYYYLVYLFVLYVMYMIHFIKGRNKTNAIRYTVTMIILGVTYLLIFPYSINHVFMGYRGQDAVSNLSSFTTMWDSIGGYLKILNNHVFNSILAIAALCIGIYILTRIVKNKTITISFRNRNLFLILTPALVYFIVIASLSPYQEIRYIMPICPAIVIVCMYLMKCLLERMLSKKKTFIAMNLIFLAMLAIPTIKKSSIEYVYNDYAEIVEETTAEADLPTVYILDKEKNRFMDDIYLLTQIDNSYIMDSKDFSSEKIAEIFKDINTEKGIRVIISEQLPHADEVYQIMQVLNKSTFTEAKRMNACNVYIIK